MPDSRDTACFRHLLLSKLQKLWICDLESTKLLYLYSEVVMLAIRLPQSIEKRLENLARRTGRTKTYYVREAILEHLEDIEDLYLAERALQRVRDDEEKTIPLKEVMKRRGSQR
jgi:RHH-type transcriptional regulator, rel operon repressor / antitoxin RelB